MMHIEDDFRTLGLSIGATKDDVNTAFRTLSKEHHSDVNETADDERQKNLSVARDRALAYLEIQDAVIPLSPKELAVTLRQSLATVSSRSARDIATGVHRRRTNSYNLTKWISIMAAGVAGLLALFAENATTLGLPEITSNTFGLVAFFFGGVSID